MSGQEEPALPSRIGLQSGWTVSHALRTPVVFGRGIVILTRLADRCGTLLVATVASAQLPLKVRRREEVCIKDEVYWPWASGAFGGRRIPRTGMATATVSRTADSRSVAILLPTLNEEDGLDRTMDELPLFHLCLAGLEPRVLVIDGRSTDATVDVARRHGATVIRQAGRGKGDAVRLGLNAALRMGSDFIAVIDADFTYASEALLPLISLLAAGSDLAIGVRRPEYDPVESFRGLAHRVGDTLLSLTAARLSRVPFLDICSGLWGVRTDAIRKLPLESDGFEIESELFLKMARQGYRVSQLPVVYRNRIGSAKLRALRDGSRILLSILRYSRVPRQGPTSVSLQYAPKRRSPSALRPSNDWLRVVQSLVFAISPPRLWIHAEPDREGEARELAQRLWAGRIKVDLTVGRENNRPELGIVSSGGATPLVRLPALIDTDGSSPSAVFHIPRNNLSFSVSDSDLATPDEVRLDRSGAYATVGNRAMRGWIFHHLAASLRTSGPSGMDALLYATADGLGLAPNPSKRGNAGLRMLSHDVSPDDYRSPNSQGPRDSADAAPRR